MEVMTSKPLTLSQMPPGCHAVPLQEYQDLCGKRGLEQQQAAEHDINCHC